MKGKNILIAGLLCLWSTLAVNAEVIVTAKDYTWSLFEGWGAFTPETVQDTRDGEMVSAQHFVVAEGQPWAGIQISPLPELLTGNYAYAHVIAKCSRSGQSVKGRFGYNDRNYENSFIKADTWQDILFKVNAGGADAIKELIIMLDYGGPFAKEITIEKIVFNDDPTFLISNPVDNVSPVLASATLVDGSITYNNVKLNVEAKDDVGVVAYQVTDDANNYKEEFIAVGNVITVNKLSPATTYNFTVKAKDAAGNLSDAIEINNVHTLSRTSEDNGDIYHFDGMSGGPLHYEISYKDGKVVYTLSTTTDEQVLNFAEVRLFKDGGLSGFYGMTIAEDGKSATYEISNVQVNECIYNMFVWGFTLPNPGAHFQNVQDINDWEKYIFYIAQEKLSLTDSDIYSNAEEKEVAFAHYSRTFDQPGAYSVYLPFKAEIPVGVTVKEYKGGADGTVRFATVSGAEMVANTPYILEVSAAGTYDFRGVSETNGKVTLKAATSVSVQSSSTQYKFTGNYEPRTGVSDVYFLHNDGSGFVKTNGASIGSFRAYIEVLPGTKKAPRLVIGEDEGGATSIGAANANGLQFRVVGGMLNIISSKGCNVKVFGLDGRLVCVLELQEGTNTVSDLAKGIYVIANQKVVLY